MTPRSLPLAAAATLLAAGMAVAPALTSPASAAPTHGDKRVCADAKAGYAACHAHVRTLITADGKVRPDATSGPTGYSAAQLRSAYGLSNATGSLTVAVVDAYRNPNARTDLQTYRDAMGITDALNFTEYNQSGVQGSYATGDVGWGQEEMLDLEMVSAICPKCPIIYVGANSAQFSDLGPAVNTAVGKGAKVVSNSYGGGEFSGETGSAYAGPYNHPGVAITVSSGDSGYGVQIPAAFNTVTAVGGTSLKMSGGVRTSETVWSGAGSGCSAYVARQAWEPSARCSRRTVADVAAVADPATGVSVYDTYGSSAGTPWFVFGGTSVAAPIIAGVYALSGNTGTTTGTLAQTIPASLSYANSGALFDVTSGSNTRRCRAGYLCSAATGYDGPTGNGTPNGSLAPF